MQLTLSSAFSIFIASRRHYQPHHHYVPLIAKMSDNNNNDELIEKERSKSAFKYVEDISPGLRLEMDLKTIYHTSISEFQEVQVIESYFGKTLVTDGKTQSTEHDEFVYHESLVHPPLFWSALLSGKTNADGTRSSGGAPKSVFIGGGGELATAREVLKHNSIERVVMVDIDPKVVEVCKKYMPEWGGEAVTNHPKMELIVGDAHQYLMETQEKFDVIIMDISDPIEAGPGIALYTQELYQRASEVLNRPNGVFVTQAGSADSVPHPHAFPEKYDEDHEEENKETWCFSAIMNTLATVFDHAIPYTAPVPSFGEDWGFVMAFNGDEKEARTLVDLPYELVDDLIEERIEAVQGVPEHRYRSKGVKRAIIGNEKGGDAMKYYDGITHGGLFSISKPLRLAMKSDERIMTVDNPVFMY
jgi:thermospermine synthase